MNIYVNRMCQNIYFIFIVFDIHVRLCCLFWPFYLFLSAFCIALEGTEVDDSLQSWDILCQQIFFQCSYMERMHYTFIFIVHRSIFESKSNVFDPMKGFFVVFVRFRIFTKIINVIFRVGLLISASDLAHLITLDNETDKILDIIIQCGII